MKKSITLLALLLLFGTGIVQDVRAQKPVGPGRFSVSMTVTEKNSNDAVMMATCVVNPLGAYTVTDIDGKATIRNIPQGQYTLEVSYVGYEKYTTTLQVNRDLSLLIQLTPTSLSLKEVVVTAQQKASGASTSSLIGRQAIDHLQASSLADVMQLIPGQLIQNTDLTAQSNLQLRTLVNNNTSAFGSSVVVDGVPMSNNGTLSQGGFSGTAFTGTDLRQISADDIDNIEVVRGIPSAEYGDLTSGLVVVHSKVGVTPWQVKGKMNPELQNYSLGKGFNLGRAGILNFGADYAKAWGDPRQKTRSYGRYSLNLGYGYDVSRRWHTDTKLRFMYAKDWSGKDPDALDDGTYMKNKNYSVALTHNGKVSLDLALIRTLSYTLGVSLNKLDNTNSAYVTNSSGLLPILTATQTGYHAVSWMTQSYLATGKTQSRPGSVFAKVNDSFYFKAGRTRQSFKLGVDYHYDWNSGRGYYNLDDARPLRPNANGRPRAFSSVPGLHQVAAYAEDQFTWNINHVNLLRANFGLRFTAMQPFGNVATYALSPRFNLLFSLTKWLDVRGGIGLNSKTPGLDYLYPDRNYADRVAANYMPQDDAAAQLLVYHTQVYDVKFSRDLKNATTTKVEVGLDFKLPGSRKLSVLAYRDRTPNGFGPYSEYSTYNYSYFDPTHGLVLTPGAATVIDYSDPARSYTAFISTGRVGNTNSTVNRGIEFDFDFGEIKPIHTTFNFSGAYSETKTWQNAVRYADVPSSLLPPELLAYDITPFKLIYPASLDYNKYRRLVNTLRVITNIPSLCMVASFTAQAIWYDWNISYVADKWPVAWLDVNLERHDLTSDMLEGYLDMDGQYHATAPAGRRSVAISDLKIRSTDAVPTKNTVNWNLSFRLTKELGRIGGLSLYVNNMLFYEPYLKNNLTSTLVQRNTGNFSYGVELFFNL